MTDPLQLQTPLVGKETVNNEWFRLIFDVPEIARQSLPGQFIHLKYERPDAPLLRRPISIYSTANQQLHLLIKTMGKGTQQMRESQIGDLFSILGPVGNTFPHFEQKRLLFISGGIGFAPLHFLYEYLHATNNIVFWQGSQTAETVPTFSFDQLFTDDGSQGRLGWLTDFLPEYLQQDRDFAGIICCGPHILMEKVSLIARRFELPCWASLEERMACGVGACYGCAVKIRRNNQEKYLRVCKDGPVFDAAEVWFE